MTPRGQVENLKKAKQQNKSSPVPSCFLGYKFAWNISDTLVMKNVILKKKIHSRIRYTDLLSVYTLCVAQMQISQENMKVSVR